MSDDAKNRTRIHIDQKLYHSPNPTSGMYLYELVNVPESKVLFKAVTGDQEDKLIRIDAPKIHLTEDEHFHMGKPPAWYHLITVNTDPVVVDHDLLTFDELVKIAFPIPPTGTDPKFTVSFEHAASKPHHGDLQENGTVTVKKQGTTFDVVHSNRS